MGGGSLLESLHSVENIFLAWEKFSAGKRSRPDVIAFRSHLEDNLFSVRDQLRDGTYRHDDYHAFVVNDPKRREIHKSTVKDRVVHQALVNVVEPLFERRFIFDSYSCRVGKGAHAGVRRLQNALARTSRNDARQVWVLKCDIAKFFASIDQARLLELVGNVVHDEGIMRLCRIIVGSFHSAPGKGIPLGNLTSQLFANVYLNKLDQFVKHTLKCRNYLRYCDDFVFVETDRTRLDGYLAAVRFFLGDGLALSLHPRKVTIQPFRRGVDFLGYVLFPHGIVPRTKTLRRAENRLTVSNRSSYFGYLSHAKSVEARRLLENRLWMFSET